MALVEVRILLCEHFQSELLETFFFSAGSVKNTSFLDPDQLFTLEATKDSNTCVWWRLSAGSRAFGVTVQFSRTFLKRDQDVSVETRKPKREATAPTLGTFLARVSKSENILLNCFDLQTILWTNISGTLAKKSQSDDFLPLFKFIVMCHLNGSRI